MIGVDLVRRGLDPIAAQPYLGTLDQWAALTVNEIRTSLQRQGYLSPDPAGEPDLDTLIMKMNDGRLVRTKDWTSAAAGDVLGETVVADGVGSRRSFTCPQGHAWQAYAPYTWRTGTTPVVESRPLCPYCVIAFSEKAFPATP